MREETKRAIEMWFLFTYIYLYLRHALEGGQSIVNLSFFLVSQNGSDYERHSVVKFAETYWHSALRENEISLRPVQDILRTENKRCSHQTCAPLYTAMVFFFTEVPRRSLISRYFTTL